MKKVIYISAIVFGFGFVSCQKQDITPAPQEMEVPVWQENARGGDENPGTPIDNGNQNENGAVEEVEITDPNIDPDAG